MLSSKRAGVQADLRGDDVSELKNTIIELPGVICDECIDARNLTSFCIGGKVSFLITVDNPESISRLLKVINEHKLDILPLGAGTNMLVSDSGFDGVFLKLGEEFRKIECLSATSIKVGGAVKISELITYLRENKLGGLSFLSGIPGTVGGAVAMNAGAFG
ncbi:FAD-binding protein, partial [bacterium]|nr:FAD-binding protein [bacterium]MBU1025324.1 FAD-binding protein [bacterium]